VGETRERPVDVRVVSASNDEIGDRVRAGTLRADFFFRISVERIDLAPLRERREDIVPLFAYYLHTLDGPCEMERDIPELLERYLWPGNVREVINIVKALVHRGTGEDVIRAGDLPLRIRDADAAEMWGQGERFAGDLELRRLLSTEYCRAHPARIRELILSSLERCRGNYSAAARELSISRATLYRRMKELDLA